MGDYDTRQSWPRCDAKDDQGRQCNLPAAHHDRHDFTDWAAEVCKPGPCARGNGETRPYWMLDAENIRLKTKLLQAKARIAQLEQVIRKHHPMIAGHAIRLRQGGEEKAATAWAEAAADFNATIGEQPKPGPTCPEHRDIQKLQARIAMLEAAAREVYLDDIQPSRWFEDNTYYRRKEHLDKLDAALSADPSPVIDVADLSRQLTEAQARIAQLEKALRDIRGLISESRGVVGYHLNGDEASWESLGYPQEIDDALSADPNPVLEVVRAAVEWAQHRTDSDRDYGEILEDAVYNLAPEWKQ